MLKHRVSFHFMPQKADIDLIKEVEWKAGSRQLFLTYLEDILVLLGGFPWKSSWTNIE